MWKKMAVKIMEGKDAGKVLYEGRVVDIEIRCYADGEYDKYALAYNEDTNKIEKYLLETTAVGVTKTLCEIDAPREIREKVWAIKEAKVIANISQKCRNEGFAIEKGSFVKVARGRKDVGAVGELFWMRENPNYTRIGIKDTKGNVYWNYLNNVDLVESEVEEKINHRIHAMVGERKQAFLEGRIRVPQ
jgi:hypothetical protein